MHQRPIRLVTLDKLWFLAQDKRCRKLLFGLLMNKVFSAPFAILFKVDFAFDLFLVFCTPIIDALAGSAGEFYKVFLRHAKN